VKELKIPFVTAEMVLPHPVLEDIVNNVKPIITLQRTMERYHFYFRRSLLSGDDVKSMMVTIDMAMREQIEWTASRSPSTQVSTWIAATHPAVQYMFGFFIRKIVSH
jgi:hypothetical protein